MKTALLKTLRLVRATALGLGLAVMVAVTLGAVTTALAAAPGDPLRLGKVNAVNKWTKLVGASPAPRLILDNNGTGPALRLLVEPGKPPMQVNSGKKVPRLNADRVDGKDAGEIGVNGHEVVTSEADNELSSGTLLSLTRVQVFCPEGKQALGGGAEIIGNTFNDFDANVALIENRPLGSTGWRAVADDMDRPDSQTGDEYALKVYAICATAP